MGCWISLASAGQRQSKSLLISSSLETNNSKLRHPCLARVPNKSSFMLGLDGDEWNALGLITKNLKHILVTHSVAESRENENG